MSGNAADAFRTAAAVAPGHVDPCISGSPTDGVLMQLVTGLLYGLDGAVGCRSFFYGTLSTVVS